MVEGQYRLVAEGLGIKHVRLVMGNSMGGMSAWMWGDKISGLHGRDRADGVAADADGRPQLDAAANDAGVDPAGPRIRQRQLHQTAEVGANAPACSSRIATAGGTLNYQKQAPTRAQADKIVDARLAAATTADANDFLWQWESSGDYDASPDLEKIEASRPRHQRGRRRAQSAGDRSHRSGDEARQERQAVC